MKELEKIPFKIGEDYENWEFDLEVVEDEEELEKYLYIKEDIKTIFVLDVAKIYLCFNFDILKSIELYFKSNSPSQDYHRLSNTVSGHKLDLELNVLFKNDKLCLTIAEDKSG